MSNGIRLRIIGGLGLTAAIIQALGHPDLAGVVLIALNLVALTAKKETQQHG